MNGNGVEDVSEAGIPHHVLNVQPGNHYVATDAAGNYSFFYFDSTITYTITAQPIPLEPNRSDGTDYLSAFHAKHERTGFRLYDDPRHP